MRNVIGIAGILIIILFALLMNINPEFRKLIDDFPKAGDQLYDQFVRSSINGVFVEKKIQLRGSYLMYIDEHGSHKFLFPDRYEPFADKVDVHDSIKKEPNKKEFYIIKSDTTFIIQPL